MRKILIALVALILGAGTVVVAQDRSDRRELRERERRLRRELREVERELGKVGDWNSSVTILTNRARLGVVVQTRADEDVDSLGALITSVTEGGPADEAGLRAGDIITRVDGEPLVDSKSRHSDFESAPGLKLIDIARDLEDGDTVEVEYLRGNLKRNTKVVAREMGAFGMLAPEILPTPAPLRILPLREGRGGNPMAYTLNVFLSGGWLDLELVSLNPGLGKYFGTKEGLLVVSAPEDSELGLESGDVILSIDGRKPKDVNHVYRILQSYDEGEEVAFDIMRDKKRTTVTGRIPERERGGEYFFDYRRRPGHDR